MDSNQNTMEYEISNNYKRNYLYSMIDGAVFAFGNGMVPISTVITYFIGSLIDSKILIGFMNTLFWLLFFTPQVFLARRLQTMKYYKKFCFNIGFLMRFMWLILGVLTFMLAKDNKGLYIVLFFIIIAIIGLLSGFNGSVWLVLSARIIPPSKFSNFLSLRASICGILEVFGAYISGIILASYESPYNYGYLFIIAFFIMMISLFIFNKYKEPQHVNKNIYHMDNKTYFKKLGALLKRDYNFQMYLLSTALIALGKMSLSFQVIYAKDKLEVTASQVAMMSTVLFITQTLGYMIWGVLVNQKGLKLAGTLSGIFFIPAILLTLWMPNVFTAFLSVAFMSFAQSYRNSNENKLVINLAPNEEELPNYIGLRNSILGPFFSLSPLFAGIILQISNFALLSLISLLLMLLGIVVFVFRVKVPEV